MPARYDPKTGKWVYDDPLSVDRSITPPPVGASDIERIQFGLDQDRAQSNLQQRLSADVGADLRPAVASGPGQLLRETGVAATNAVVGLGTDYLDLAAGLGDLAGITARGLTGQGWDWDGFLDDSNNPWTQWRRQTFRMETQAGQVVSNVARIGVALLSLPKVAALGVTAPLRVASKIPVAGGVARAGLTGIDRLGDAYRGIGKADETADAITALQSLRKAVPAAAPASKAIDRATRNDWLTLSYREVAEGVFKRPQLSAVETWWKSTEAAVTQLARGSKTRRLKTIGEALAWDAFVAFNVYGEGDSEFDETFSDMLVMMDAPWAQAIGSPLATYAEDTSLTRKVKQMIEGLTMAVPLNMAFDTYRVYQFAKNFKKASPEVQADILYRMGSEAQGIGDTLGRMLASDGVATGQRVSSTSALNTALESARRAQVAKADFLQARAAAQQLDAQMPPAEGFGPAPFPAGGIAGIDPALPPGVQGGPLALISPPVDPVRVTELPFPARGEWPELPNRRPAPGGDSPVQQRLAQMEGVASPVNPDDVLYQQRLQEQARFADPGVPMPPPSRPVPPGDSAVQQRLAQMEGVASPVNPDDVLYQQRLQQQALLNDPGAPFPPQGQLPPSPGIAGQLQGANTAGLLPGSPVQTGYPGADPAGLMGAGGPPVPVTPGMIPVQVEDLGPTVPRGPSPVVTPQTIRDAFERDALRVFREARDMTLVEGPDGVFRSLGTEVKRLIPRTRVDAIEYLKAFPPQANEIGMVNGVDSIWINFMYDRGLQEGWATIDPDTFQIKFNRAAAAQVDRDGAVMRQAQAIDEAVAVNDYNENLVDVTESFRAAQQEQPLEVDQLQSQRLAEAEQDPAAMAAAREAIDATRELDRFDAGEQLRITQAEQLAITGEMTDEQVVREMLGRNLADLPTPEIRRAETGRAWEVYDANGELLMRTTTRRQAQQAADRQLAEDRSALVKQARQMEEDQLDEVINGTIGRPELESNIVGSVKLTDQQIAAIQQFSPAIQKQMRENWDKRTGGQAFYNINEMGPGKKTFELTQGEMFDLVDGIKALLQTGEIASPRAKVLRNVADKLDTQMKLLEPQARAQRFVQGIVDDAAQYLEGGQFCNYL